MSDFTTELRYLIDSGYPLGLDKYPIFDENYRETLNGLIKNHFYFHEINHNSAQRFVFDLNNVLREIMPYYNQLYSAELLAYDPFEEYSKELKITNSDNQNVIDKIIEIIDGNTVLDSTAKTDNITTQNDSSTVKTNVDQNDNSQLEEKSNTAISGTDSSIVTGDAKSVGSNTPKDLLTIGTIENNVYANQATIAENAGETNNSNNNNTDFKHDTNASNNSSVESKNDASSNATSVDDTKVDVDSSTKEDKSTTKDVETSTTNSGESTTTDSGHNSSKTKLIVELRDSFINVDQMVLDDWRLQECFMQVYGNDD